MSLPYESNDALQRRMAEANITSLGDEAKRHSSANTAKPLKWTERAKVFGAGAVSAAALGGILYAGMHGNAEANKDYNKDHTGNTDSTGQVHNPKSGNPEPSTNESGNVIDYLQGDK